MHNDRLGKVIGNTQVREYFPESAQEERAERLARIAANREADKRHAAEAEEEKK